MPYRKLELDKQDIIKGKGEDGEYGEDTGSVWGNIKKGLGLDPNAEAQMIALDNKLKKAKAWGYNE